MKWFIYILTGLAVPGSLLHAREAQLLDENMLSRLRAEAATAHPSALAGRQKANAASQEVRAVRLWDDPMMGVGFMAADQMMRRSDGDIMIGFEQNLPKPGMYDATRRKAEAMGRAEAENARDSSLAAGAGAARTAIELALADEAIALQQAQLAWISAIAENAVQRVADPLGSATDSLRMEAEVARETQILDAARRNRDGYAQKLNLILGRPLESPWPVLSLPADPPPVPLARSEIARIPHANPKVRAMREMAGAARAESQITDRERLPGVSIGVDAAMYSGGDYRSTTVGLKVSLPWFNDPSYRAKTEAAKSRERAATNDVETMRRDVAARVLTAATDAANAAAQARALGGEIHQKALAATSTTEAAWISSKAPLTDLLDSSRVLFSIRLEQRRFIAMQLAALEELETLVPHR